MGIESTILRWQADWGPREYFQTYGIPSENLQEAMNFVDNWDIMGICDGDDFGFVLKNRQLPQIHGNFIADYDYDDKWWDGMQCPVFS